MSGTGLFAFEQESPTGVARSGNAAAQDAGLDVVPVGSWRQTTNTFEQTFADNPTTGLVRRAWRNLTSNVLTIDAEEANRRFGIAGSLSFDGPIRAEDARDISEHRRANILRRNIASRGEGGFFENAGWLGATLLGSAVDPLNLAVALIPIVGEARVAAMFGTAAAGAFGRAGVRGVQGFVSGAVGTALLEPLNYSNAMSDRDDYTMGQVATNIAFGAALGGVLSPVLGRFLIDRNGRLPTWAPELHETALRQATAAMSEGAPVNAANAIELASASVARRELMQWSQSRMAQAADADTAIAQAANAEIATRATATRLGELRGEVATLRREAAGLSDQEVSRALSVGERGRLSELTRIARDESLPLSERLTAGVERRALLDQAEGLPPRPYAEGEAARDAAQRAGTETAARRAEIAANRTGRSLDNQLSKLEAADDSVRAMDVASAAREAVTASLAARTLRRLAAKTGRVLDEAEIDFAVAKLFEADDKNVAAVVDDILNNLFRRQASPVAQLAIEGNPASLGQDVQAVMAKATNGLIAAEARATQALATASGVSGNEQVAQQLARWEGRAPKIDGVDVVRQTAEAERIGTEMLNVMRQQDDIVAARAKAEGRQPPARDAELEAIEQAYKNAEGDARALEAAATCRIGG